LIARVLLILVGRSKAFRKRGVCGWRVAIGWIVAISKEILVWAMIVVSLLLDLLIARVLLILVGRSKAFRKRGGVCGWRVAIGWIVAISKEILVWAMIVVSLKMAITVLAIRVVLETMVEDVSMGLLWREEKCWKMAGGDWEKKRKAIVVWMIVLFLLLLSLLSVRGGRVKKRCSIGDVHRGCRVDFR
jgi:mannitol-specific phosphotransferase system IIBC component